MESTDAASAEEREGERGERGVRGGGSGGGDGERDSLVERVRDNVLKCLKMAA